MQSAQGWGCCFHGEQTLLLHCCEYLGQGGRGRETCKWISFYVPFPGFYLISPSEFERFSLSTRNITEPLCVLETSRTHDSISPG